MFQSPTSSSCSSAQAGLLAAILFLSQLLLNKYFPLVRQSSSTGKSPHAQHTPTLPTTPSTHSAPFFSSYVNSIWDPAWRKKEIEAVLRNCLHFLILFTCILSSLGIFYSLLDLYWQKETYLLHFLLFNLNNNKKKKRRKGTSRRWKTCSCFCTEWNSWPMEAWVRAQEMNKYSLFCMFDCKLW